MDTFLRGFADELMKVAVVVQQPQRQRAESPAPKASPSAAANAHEAAQARWKPVPAKTEAAKSRPAAPVSPVSPWGAHASAAAAMPKSAPKRRAASKQPAPKQTALEQAGFNRAAQGHMTLEQGGFNASNRSKSSAKPAQVGGGKGAGPIGSATLARVAEARSKGRGVSGGGGDVMTDRVNAATKQLAAKGADRSSDTTPKSPLSSSGGQMSRRPPGANLENQPWLRGGTAQAAKSAPAKPTAGSPAAPQIRNALTSAGAIAGGIKSTPKPQETGWGRAKQTAPDVSQSLGFDPT